MKKENRKKEFGDFQTPTHLAKEICENLKNYDFQIKTIFEPTCGIGNLLVESLKTFPKIQKAIGIEVNSEHFQFLIERLNRENLSDKSQIFNQDFFKCDWQNLIKNSQEPILILGNPPWVTNSDLGKLGSNNLPAKNNHQNGNGIEAITGKSNFDVSEWILNQILEFSTSKEIFVAMICKLSVARKVLQTTWKKRIPLKSDIFRIDAKANFNASVDACLLVCRNSDSVQNECRVFSNLSFNEKHLNWGFANGKMIANSDFYEKWKHLEGREIYKWRSGIKHDCSKIMEFKLTFQGLENGLGETCNLEADLVLPLLKSSDLANGKVFSTKRRVLVTQKNVGETTDSIRFRFPKTWNYLYSHLDFFEKRKSSVYKNKPLFSIFGVGDYSFAPYKVAISGLYKSINFVALGSEADKPIILDDTCYFLSCRTEKEAKFLAEILNSKPSREFLKSHIFWDSKRPITIEILKKLDLLSLSQELGKEEEFRKLTSNSLEEQLVLF